MSVYRLERTIELPITIEQAWSFFSSPANLEKITPPGLKFRVTSTLPDVMYPGMIITYRLNVLPFTTSEWVTEITHVDPPHRFVDEQRLGPYRLWHHQHFFHETAHGVEIRDLVHYCLPLGMLGRLVNLVLVERRLRAIFDYRAQALLGMLAGTA